MMLYNSGYRSAAAFIPVKPDQHVYNNIYRLAGAFIPVKPDKENVI